MAYKSKADACETLLPSSYTCMHAAPSAVALIYYIDSGHCVTTQQWINSCVRGISTTRATTCVAPTLRARWVPCKPIQTTNNANIKLQPISCGSGKRRHQCSVEQSATFQQLMLLLGLINVRGTSEYQHKCIRKARYCLCP